MEFNAGSGSRRIAALMPARNASEHIRSALDSLVCQRDAIAIEVIVVDDGSTDSTREIVAEFGRTAPEVRLIVQQPHGIPFARNAAISSVSADTEFITFLDSDDLSPPGRLARDLAILVDDPSLDLVWGMTQPFQGEADLGRLSMLSHLRERRSQLAGLFMRRSLLERVGGFNETIAMGEDVDFILRMLETGPRLHLSQEIAVLYRRHQSNATRDIGLVRETLARAYLLAAQRRRRGAPRIPDGIFQPAAIGKDPP